MMMEQINILGISFVNATRKQFVEHLHKHIYTKKKAFVVTANPEIVIKAHENKAYKETITQADYVTADGIGVVKAAKLLKTPLPERVTGFDLLIDLLELANEYHYSIYLLGASETTLTETVKHINDTYPNVHITGSHHGYFDWKSNHIQTEIKEKKPDLVFVALGVPRQENWVASNISSFQKGVFIGVGGSFDVLAGTVKRAPVAWQKANLEWLYRMMKQPSRLKRSLALPKFALKVLKEKAKVLK